MEELDFALDGVWASTKGITLQKPVSFSAAVPRVKKIQIPGRNGDLHIDEGAYNNRTGTALCYALEATKVTSQMDEIMSFLFASKGYRKLEVSDDTDHYWEARVANGGDIAARLGMLNPFSISFDCKPYRRYPSGDTAIVISGNTTITNETGFPAYPLIYVVAASGGSFRIGYGEIDFSDSFTGYIDCADMRAYSALGTSLDHLIAYASYPVLNVGSNSVQLVSGITSMQIYPHWQTL